MAKMKLSSPKRTTWWVALVLGAVGLLASVVSIPVLSGLAFWLVLAGLVLLLVATAVKGL
jgi:hypothetical protein